jgi:uncharacterized protein YjbJ (UPF0337 family)
MISIKTFRSFFIAISLALFLATTIGFGWGSTDSWAATKSQVQIASINRVEAITKNIEGKAQEALGNLTGNPRYQIAGKAKQVESQARNAVEDIKDKTQLRGRTKAVTKNIEGKFQEAKGKATGNRQDQVDGQAKQIESQARNAVENVKDWGRDILN